MYSSPALKYNFSDFVGFFAYSKCLAAFTQILHEKITPPKMLFRKNTLSFERISYPAFS